METVATQDNQNELDEHPWYALRVRSNFEKTAALALEGRGYEMFSPTYRDRRQWSDRVKEVDVPLFGGYVFCRLDLQNRLPVLTAPGVVQIVGQGRIPIAVPDREIDAVRAVLNSQKPYAPGQAVSVGQKIVMKSGPLAGVEGVLVNIKNQCRLIVSVQLLQRAVSVEVESQWAGLAEDGWRQFTNQAACA